MTRQTIAPLKTLWPASEPRPASFFHQNREYIELGAVGTASEPWSYGQRIALVYSWLSGVPIPVIVVNTDWQVIDGTQRITTAHMWFDGELSVPHSWFTAADLDPARNNAVRPHVRFTDLSQITQFRIRHDWLLPTCVARTVPADQQALLRLVLNGDGIDPAAGDEDPR